MNFKDIEGLENRIIICNPPYGIRMESEKSLVPLLKDFGAFLRERCRGSAAFVYFGDKQYIRNTGLKPSWKKPLKGGGLDGVLVKYEIFK